MNEIELIIEDQFKTLPQNLQRAIKDAPWKALVQEIGKDNTLDVEQIIALEQETMFIIYAFENPKDYISNLVKNVGLTEDEATIIADTVGERILSVIDVKAKEIVPQDNKVIEQSFAPTSVPEIAPNNLPMVEKGETSHEVPHIEPTIQTPQPIKPEDKKVGVPDYRYEGGKDPYREPLV